MWQRTVLLDGTAGCRLEFAISAYLLGVSVPTLVGGG